MSWKQCVISINDSYERFEDGLCLLARAHGQPADLALFTRTTPDRCRRVLLLSPRAVELAGDVLSSQWTDCEAPELFEWDTVYGPPDACERLGLCRPKFGRGANPTPAFVLGRESQALNQDDEAARDGSEASRGGCA